MKVSVLILSILVAVCYAQTPAKPNIAETFMAKVKKHSVASVCYRL